MAFLVYGSKFRVFLVSVWPELENWTVLITILQKWHCDWRHDSFLSCRLQHFPAKASAL